MPNNNANAVVKIAIIALFFKSVKKNDEPNTTFGFKHAQKRQNVVESIVF